MTAPEAVPQSHLTCGGPVEQPAAIVASTAPPGLGTIIHHFMCGRMLSRAGVLKEADV